uniref:Plexin cytoplasmic RasGAP domain-containing protein n=1 Tax=Meloidogyne enterolobii TaxID=390850 RepID=A0A6V7USI6_MELEN|nr:unnamed protein product [Meloidogyne enterolobii]
MLWLVVYIKARFTFLPAIFSLCRTYSFFNTSPASLHPVLRELTVVQDRALQVESSLRQLHCLFQNRIFLLCVVRSIDSNKYLLVKDRVYVGSLFLVVLQLTDVLKQLLRDLIRRNVETKFQPKILFHRAESVVERMLSAWFAFLMYKDLRRSAGKQFISFTGLQNNKLRKDLKMQ